MRTPAVLVVTLAWLAACKTPPAPNASPNPAGFLALGIANAKVAPLPHTFCSGQATPEQFAQLPAMGIQRVISLRPATEAGTGWEEAKAKELGLEFVRIAIAGADDLTSENLERLSRARAPHTPTLITCASSNRVGAMLALAAQRDGTPPAQALALGKQCGLAKLESAVKERLGL
jgi:protein tyrosine phosphatase (PTP) superfamily phosphohydrolase (DUF442 family)